MSLTSIVDLSNKRPRAFVKVSLGTGPRASGAAPITMLLMGNKTTVAPANPLTNDTMEQVFNEQDVIDKTGAGSELHRAYRQVTKINNQASIWIGAIAESAGAAAALTKTLTGTATEDATLELTIGSDTPLNIAVTSGDAAATVIQAVLDAVNAVAHTPVIATSPATNIVYTAKSKGPRGNQIKIRSRWVTGTGAGLTYAAAANGEALSAGSTNDDPTNLLANATTVRFHLTVAPYGDTSETTPLDLVIAQAVAQAGPLIGKRGRVIIGNVEVQGTAQTFAFTDLNEELVQCAWSQLANETAFEVAAALAGRLSIGLGLTRRFNFDGTTLDGLSPQWNVASQPLETEVTTALNNGLTPVVVSGGEVQVARSITSKSRTAAGGAVFDFSVLDTHYVDVAFFVADLLEENWPVAFPNFALGIDIEGEVPPPGVATANTTKTWALGLLAPFDNDLLENFQATTVRGSIFERNETAKGRIDAVLPIDVIELFHQFAADVQQQG
jgi:phage tail sheath gpL-like